MVRGRAGVVRVRGPFRGPSVRAWVGGLVVRSVRVRPFRVRSVRDLRDCCVSFFSGPSVRPFCHVLFVCLCVVACLLLACARSCVRGSFSQSVHQVSEFSPSCQRAEPTQ